MPRSFLLSIQRRLLHRPQLSAQWQSRRRQVRVVVQFNINASSLQNSVHVRQREEIRRFRTDILSFFTYDFIDDNTITSIRCTVIHLNNSPELQLP